MIVLVARTRGTGHRTSAGLPGTKKMKITGKYEVDMIQRILKKISNRMIMDEAVAKGMNALEADMRRVLTVKKSMMKRIWMIVVGAI
jgi:hypothetical protein